MASSAVITLEAELLENLITRGWHYLFRFHTCLAEEKQQLDGFLDTYYAQLGGWLQQAAQAAGTGEGGETTTTRVNHLHAHHKYLYRDTLKLCHPDVCAHPHAAHWVRQVQQAYTEGNGYRLTTLRLIIRQETLSAAEYLHSLHREYHQLQAQVGQAREALQSMRHSPAYRLQQRITHARRRGVDLLSHIAQQWRMGQSVAA